MEVKLFWFFSLVLACEIHGMTKEQLMNTGKLFRKKCLAKTNVELEKIEGIINGEFHEEKPVMCYTSCIFQFCQVLKGGKFNYEASMKQADLLYPPEMKDDVKAQFTACKDVAKKFKEPCESSYRVTYCMWESDPEGFYFP